MDVVLKTQKDDMLDTEERGTITQENNLPDVVLSPFPRCC